MQDPAEFITVPADPKYHRFAVTATGFNLIFCFIDRPPKSLFFGGIPPPGDQAAMQVVSAARLGPMISR